jgi:hypothetical protein
MKAVVMAAAVSLVAILLSGGAQATDGNTLLNDCQATIRLLDTKQASPNETIGIGQCLGMVEAVRSTLVIFEDQIPKNFRGCVPNGGINNGQSVRIVNKYLHDNPAKLNQDATMLILLAYHEAFPCE